MHTLTIPRGALVGCFGLLAMVGCSADDKPAIDAGVLVDASAIDATLIDAPAAVPDAPTSVQVITCPNATTPTVVTSGSAYSPVTTTIAVEGIVKFTMPGNHNVIPDPALMTDDGLNVGFATTRCLKFTVAGTYNFKCGPHQFKGNVVVN